MACQKEKRRLTHTAFQIPRQRVVGRSAFDFTHGGRRSAFCILPSALVFELGMRKTLLGSYLQNSLFQPLPPGVYRFISTDVPDLRYRSWTLALGLWTHQARVPFCARACPTFNKPKIMSNFSYEAVDSGGLKIEGHLEVIDQNEAVRRVKEMGLFPVRIVEARTSKRGMRNSERGKGRRVSSGALRVEIKVPFLGGRVKGAVLAIFTRQLSTLIEAGMPLLRGLRILREQEDSLALQKILDSIADQIEGGGSLSEALAAHPKVFNGLYINMVKAGELSGALEITLRRLADFMEKAQKIRGKVKAAMFYPVSVMVVATGILTLLMVYIIPKFREVFDGFGIQLPAFTRFVLGVSTAIRGHFLWIVAGAVLVWIGVWYTGRTVGGRRFFDHLKLSMPVFGPVFKKLAISRFARTLGTLLCNGVPILQALNIVKETTGNVVVSRVISSVHDSVKEGDTIALPLKASGVFPAMVAGMVDIGEQTGALPDMLMKVADNYDDQVDNAVTSMTSLLEPIMLVFLAVVVGGIVLAMFWPIIILMNDPGVAGGGGGRNLDN
jgi:type IV pilus assembly protein PilC